jgi:hypothetical protein
MRSIDSAVTSATTPLLEVLTPTRYRAVRTAWERSLGAAHGPSRNLIEAMREAINAVEGLARIVSGSHSSTLGEIIRALKGTGKLSPTIAKSLEAVWGFTNTTPGIRHGAATEVDIPSRDARFILESCEAAVRLLLDLDIPGSGAPV